LVGAPPERPGDDGGGPDTPLRDAGGDAADLLERPSDEARRAMARGGSIFLGGAARFAWWRTRASTAKASITKET
jgi:hypothetical protein